MVSESTMFSLAMGVLLAGLAVMLYGVTLNNGAALNPTIAIGGVVAIGGVLVLTRGIMSLDPAGE
jgi:hypothetical protein